MTVDRRLVLEDELLVGSVSDGHDIHVREFRSALAPVGVGENVVTADFPSRLDLAPVGYAPMEQRVVAGNALAGGRGLHVLEKGGESSDHLARAQRSRHVNELVERNSCFHGPWTPRVGCYLVDCELAFE